MAEQIEHLPESIRANPDRAFCESLACNLRASGIDNFSHIHSLNVYYYICALLEEDELLPATTAADTEDHGEENDAGTKETRAERR